MIAWLKGLLGAKPKRQRRYVLNVQREMPLEYLLDILRANTPVISQREYAKLAPHLQKLFVPCRKS